jgi:xanthine dehydrogenase YagS FAD-binding subunit
MDSFEYARPTTEREAIQLLAHKGAEVLAGGTDLLSLMKDDLASPERLVSLKRVPTLRGIQFSTGQGLRIGAMTTLQELADHPDVRQHYAALSQAAIDAGGPQIRAMGTLGGNLLQRPRCWYYRAGYGLLAQKDGKSLVPDGDNRYHAILGNAGPAYFVSPSTLAPLLIALGASVKLLGPKGSRQIELGKLYTIPTSETQREHTIEAGEILTEVLVPYDAQVRSASYEIRQRQGEDWPLAQAAVALRGNGSIRSARVVLGHVAPIPWRSEEAEAELSGKPVSEEVADAAGRAAVSKATPLSMNKYKVQLARVAVKRAILRAAGMQVEGL